MLQLRSCTPLLLVLALMALLPAAAQADERIATSYTSANTPVLNLAGNPIDCGKTWSGGTDGIGNFYQPCGQYIFIFNATGTYTGNITVPTGYQVLRDVAANADGTIVYAVTGRAIDQPVPGIDPNTGYVLRFIKSATTGTWSAGTVFLNPITWIAGDNAWSIRNLSVAGNGHVFVTSNVHVREYDTFGNEVTTFGDENSLGDVVEGIQANNAGDQVWVTSESKASNVQRWDRDPAGGWHRSVVLGSLTKLDTSDCLPSADDHRFSNPYDVGLDGAGNIYVMDTSCMRIRKFSSTGVFRADVWRNYFDHGPIYHGFAVNWQGNVFVPEMARVFTRSGLPTVQDTSCAPDSDAPHFTRLSRPSTVYDRSVLLDIVAGDGCSTVTGMKITGDLVGGGTWGSPSARTITLTPGSAVKTLTLTLQDTYGHQSAVTIAITYDASLPTPRRHVNIAGASSTCHANPMKALASSNWRLADACATYTGKVLAIKHSGRSVSVRILIGEATAHKMFSNAHGPVPIWVAGSRATTTSRQLRIGANARVTSALVVDRHLRSIAGAPAWRWGRV